MSEVLASMCKTSKHSLEICSAYLSFSYKSVSLAQVIIIWSWKVKKKRFAKQCVTENDQKVPCIVIKCNCLFLFPCYKKGDKFALAVPKNDELFHTCLQVLGLLYSTKWNGMKQTNELNKQNKLNNCK